MNAMASLFGSGMTRSAKIKKAFLGGVSFGAYGAVTDVAMIGFQASRAGRGGFVPAIVGQGAAIGLGVPLAGFASAALCLIPGIGPLTAAIIGTTMTDYAEFRFGSSIARGIRMFTDLNKRVRHLEMGGNYKDTQYAQRQRLIAIQDMNASLLPGRRYLGQEAMLTHR